MMRIIFFRVVGLFFVFSILSSCTWISSKEERTQRIAEKELLAIDWNDVDHYPLFEDCDESSPKEQQRQCFEEHVLKNISQSFEEQNFIFETDLEYTVYVDFIVNKQGMFQVADIERNRDLLELMPDLNRIINRSFTGLPRVEPALKRGVPVSTKFRIPLSFNTP